jgi:hypothetical protein
VSTTAEKTDAPVFCANHPGVETAVSCSDCGKPICPDCMVAAPVGMKCRECARQPRSARVTLRGGRGVRAAAAAFGGGTIAGLLVAYTGIGLGFLTLILGFVVGLALGRLTLRASGYYRAPVTGWIAAAGAAWGYLLAIGLIAAAGERIPAFALLGMLVAAYVCYREAT